LGATTQTGLAAGTSKAEKEAKQTAKIKERIAGKGTGENVPLSRSAGISTPFVALVFPAPLAYYGFALQYNFKADFMKKHSCEECRWRRYAERKPQTLLAKIWRWHTTWCPGWKAYQRSLSNSDGEKTP
jgi:hypothetical protein